MNLLNLEDEKFKTVNVKGYQFKIRFMSPLDRVQITQQRMLLQNGNPVEALSQYDFTFFENIAMVNICVEEQPEGFKENESCIKWEDIELINGVANEIREHTNEIELKLKKNKPIGGSGPE
jgi:hypothetical protein